MKKYPKQRKPSGYTTCEICGKKFIARGIGTHRREAHKMVFRKLNYYSKDASRSTVSCTKTTENSSSGAPLKYYNSLSIEANSDKLLSEAVKNTSSDCKQPERFRLYTDTDLLILYGRIRLVFYSQFYPPHIMKWRLIKDFENRFECKFDDAKEANPHISPNKEFAENPNLLSKYAAMKYSR